MAIFKKYRHSREGVVITLKIGGGKKKHRVLCGVEGVEEYQRVIAMKSRAYSFRKLSVINRIAYS